MVDIKFGTQLFFSQSYDFLQKKVLTANKENWDSLWLPDHLSGLPGGMIDDFLAVWPLFGAFCELAKGKTFGSAVTDPHRLHPAVLAQIATTLNHMSGGNFILGIGAGEGMNLKVFNIPYDHAISKMEESILLMKQFWKKGKRVTFKGKFYETNKAVLLPQPISDIPIWVAGNGLKTRDLTARVTDGWMPVGLFFDVYKAGKEEITKKIKQEGRDLNKFTFGIWQRIFINDDEKRIEEQLNATKFGLIMSPRVLKSLGYWKEGYDQLFCDATGFECDDMSLLVFDREDMAKFDMGKLSKITEQIPNEALRKDAMIGTKEELIKKIERFVKIGTQYFIFEIQNGSSSKNAPFTYWDVSRILSEEIIPLFKED
jgi:phthiodiolone/phenolphthiodiolone dimycocerosates ketoreductase